jgi:hypothetical protein
MHNAKLLNLILGGLIVLNFGCGANQSTTPSTASQPAAKPVADDPILDLPDYPGAKRTAYATGDDSANGFSKTVKAELLTSDPFDKVIEFYGNAYRDHGWKPLNIESSSASADESRMVLNLSKGTSVGKVEINQKGKGNVTIALERKEK